MKRILVCFLMNLLILTSIAAAQTDLSSMTLDELVDLRREVITEICKRVSDGEGGSVMHTGKFTVGQDIKANYYHFTAIDENDGFTINIYPTSEMIWGERTTLQADLGESYTANLMDGMVVEVVRGIGFVQVIDKPDWAP